MESPHQAKDRVYIYFYKNIVTQNQKNKIERNDHFISKIIVRRLCFHRIKSSSAELIDFFKKNTYALFFYHLYFSQNFSDFLFN